MGGGDAVDGVTFAGGFGKTEEAADVVVLVERGEEAFCFFHRKTKHGNGNGIAKLLNEAAVAINEFLQRHERGATGCFGGHGKHQKKSLMLKKAEAKK